MFSGLIPGLNSVNWTDDELPGDIPASLISLLGLPKQVLSFEAHPGTIVGLFPRIQYLAFLWQQWTQFGLVIWVYGWIAIILFIWACYTSGEEGKNGGDAAAAGEPPEETAISGPMHLFRDALFNAIGGEPCQSLCEICFEERYNWKMFRSETCSHSFCCDCISKHIAAKIQDNIAVVLCPGVDCKVALDFEESRRIIAKEVAVRWDECLCMSLIPESQRVYCPFRDCSVMLVKDPGDINVEEIDCPACQRSICAHCGVPWHSEFTCEEFERLRAKRKEKEDVFVEELAKKKSWRKCPHCKMYVEKTEGCLHITCRCAHEFCYRCGANWTKKHGENCRQVQGFEPPLVPRPPTSSHEL